MYLLAHTGPPVYLGRSEGLAKLARLERLKSDVVKMTRVKIVKLQRDIRAVTRQSPSSGDTDARRFGTESRSVPTPREEQLALWNAQLEALRTKLRTEMETQECLWANMKIFHSIDKNGNIRHNFTTAGVLWQLRQRRNSVARVNFRWPPVNIPPPPPLSDESDTDDWQTDSESGLLSGSDSDADPEYAA